MGFGIDRFLPWKNGIQATGTDLVSGNGKKCQKSKMGMAFEHCKEGFRKQMARKWEWYRPPFWTLSII